MTTKTNNRGPASDASPAPRPKPNRALSLAELMATDFPQLPVERRRVYGIWTLEDGREVLFDRDYCSLYSRRPGELAEIAEPQRPGGIVKESFLWEDDDSLYRISPATQRKLQAVLRAWGIVR